MGSESSKNRLNLILSDRYFLSDMWLILFNFSQKKISTKIPHFINTHLICYICHYYSVIFNYPHYLYFLNFIRYNILCYRNYNLFLKFHLNFCY